ncbi:MAG: hypothetical protein WDZ45_11225 [Flavobacteriaceae bacterium]
MSVRIETIENKKNKNNSTTIELMFFIALNVLVIPFSAYQTFVGYEKDVAGHQILAIVVALISAVLFAAMNFGIREKRLKGQRHILMVIMYVIPLGLSFFGNFNAFYSNQMKDTLLRSEISSYKHQLTTTHDEAIMAIKNKAGLDSINSTYSQLWIALKTEYYDLTPAGWGPKSEEKWIELTSFLQSYGSSIKISDKGKSTTNYFENAQISSENAKNAIIASKEREMEPTLNYIDQKYNTVYSEIDSLNSLSKPKYTSSMLDKMVVADNDIRSKTESYLATQNLFSQLALAPSQENDIGTIKHTINSAFIKKENPSATWFSLFLSLIIDLSALLYIMVFIPYKIRNRKGRVNSGPQPI